MVDCEFERHPFWYVSFPLSKFLYTLTSQSDTNSRFQITSNLLGGRIINIPLKLTSFSRKGIYICVCMCVCMYERYVLFCVSL